MQHERTKMMKLKEIQNLIVGLQQKQEINKEDLKTIQEKVDEFEQVIKSKPNEISDVLMLLKTMRRRKEIKYIGTPSWHSLENEITFECIENITIDDPLFLADIETMKNCIDNKFKIKVAPYRKMHSLVGTGVFSR